MNSSRALQLEISKVAQYTELAKFGIRTPRTVAAVGRDNIIAAARLIDAPFITKHNRAGKGLGVKLFQGIEALRAHVDGLDFAPSVDGITLIQQYIQAPKPFITRVEFVGGAFLYAVRVDTSSGFELCPADVCEVGDALCPADAPVAASQFQILDDFTHPIVDRYRKFLAANGIGIAGIEFIVDREGQLHTYDVNTNTNYNSAAEARAGKYGMRAIAAYLERERRTMEQIAKTAPAIA